MKKLLALLLVLTMTFSLAACGNKDKEKTPSDDDKTVSDNQDKDKDKDTDEKDSEPKVLRLLDVTNIPKLITWQSTDNISFQILGNVLGGLFIKGADGTPKEDMVDTYEVSEDGLTYTFNLKKGAQWVDIDGNPYAEVTANDFVFAWKKLLDPAEAAQYASLFETCAIKNGSTAFKLQNEIVTYEKNDKSLKNLKVENYEDTDEATAKEQYDEAKKSLEEKVTTLLADLEGTYGSVDKAKEKLVELVDTVAITAEDDYTFKIELDAPVPYLIDLLCFPALFPANEKFYNEVGADKYGKSAKDFLYNGAFIFKDWKISERHYLVKNEHYWDVANVDLDAIDSRVIEDANNDTRVNMYLEGQIDRTVLSGENVDKYGNRPDAVLLPETGIQYLQVNPWNGALTPARKVLQDVRARKAINMAIDKSYITDIVLKNGSIPTDGFVPTGFVASADHDGKDFREVAEDLYGGGKGYNTYNPEEASKLWKEAMDELGMTEVTIDLMLGGRETDKKNATHIKDEMEKNLPGCTVEISTVPWGERLLRTAKGDFIMNWTGWGPDYPDSPTFLEVFTADSEYNNGKYNNPQYDATLKSAKTGDLTNPAKSKERFEKLVELEKILLEDDQAVIPMYQASRLILMNRKVKNMTLQQSGADYIYKWVKFE
jgi:oligopeptide transport system substrate-binding protein